MKPWRILLAFYLGLVLSTLLLLAFGASGFRRYRALAAYRDVLTDNIEELQEIQRRLAYELDAMRTNPEQVALQARELGYFRRGERVIRMKGAEAPAAGFYRVGRLVYRTEREWKGDRLLRAAFLVLSILIYGLLRLLRRRGPGARRRGLHAHRIE